jgi:hypothetical protein
VEQELEADTRPVLAPMNDARPRSSECRAEEQGLEALKSTSGRSNVDETMPGRGALNATGGGTGPGGRHLFVRTSMKRSQAEEIWSPRAVERDLEADICSFEPL